MTSSTNPKTVLLSGDPIHYEAVSASGSAIVPGMLIEMVADGEVQEHSTADGEGSAMFAREADYIGGTIDDAYAVGDSVPYYVGRKGDRFFAFLADEENVVAGALLVSDGDGALKAPDGDNPGPALAKATEAVNNTSGGAAVRIRVEVV